MDIKISILVPTFNRAAMVCEALDLIIKYDCPEILEVIVSDNHSTDGTLEILREKYASFTKLLLTQPTTSSGPLGNWQQALSLASGTHVHWHWSDDYLCGPFYEKAVATLKKENAAVLISAVKIVFEDGFEPVSYSQGFTRSENSKVALKKLMMLQDVLPVSPAACILPLKAVQKHFYTDLPRVGDYDPIKWAMGTDALMIAGALLEHDKVAYLEKPLFCFRSHGGCLTNVYEQYQKSYCVAFEWFIRKYSLNIPLSLRRKKFGLLICNSFEKKFSWPAFTGFLLKVAHVLKSNYRILRSKI